MTSSPKAGVEDAPPIPPFSAMAITEGVNSALPRRAPQEPDGANEAREHWSQPANHLDATSHERHQRQRRR
jgi:hypothetical protein